MGKGGSSRTRDRISNGYQRSAAKTYAAAPGYIKLIAAKTIFRDLAKAMVFCVQVDQDHNVLTVSFFKAISSMPSLSAALSLFALFFTNVFYH